jgi:tRNA-2-methylthio-N6-dimethylallyladenosine synthase
MTSARKKDAENLAQLSEEHGPGKSAYIVTFGCQMNQHDSEIIGGLLERAGFQIVPDVESADVVLFNTCCVREHAEQRLYSRISQLKRLKAERPDLVLAVGGCVAQKEKTALVDRFPHVDIVFGTHAVMDIVSLLEKAERNGRPVVQTPEDGPEPRTDVAIDSSGKRIHAWISIMRGCNNYCSYCVVPYVRGPQRSKHPTEVADEMRVLATNGIVEVTLLGQNVNSYGQDIRPATSFVELLRTLNEISGIARIRFTTSHPKDLSSELIHAIHDLERVCEHLHLPVQSGSSRILGLMNRGYDAEEYIKKVEQLRETVPDIGLTTDVIVGFPGETDDDFEQTRSLLERVRFDGAYIFKYSTRPGTAALKLDGEVERETIIHRHRTLLDFQKKISLSRLREAVNTIQPVLVEKDDSKRPGHVLGRTRGYRVVSFPGNHELIGREVDVRIADLGGWTLIGEKLIT